MSERCYKFYLLVLYYNISGAASQTKNFRITRFELCNKTQGLMKYSGNVTTESGKQYLTFDVDMPIPWDENLGSRCSIQTVMGSNAIELFMIKEKNYCKAVHKYMGEFWYDIERAAQITPGLCPIPAGRYHVRHLHMNFEKITLQTFPLGKLRFIMRAIDNKNPNAHILCNLIEVDNS